VSPGVAVPEKKGKGREGKEKEKKKKSAEGKIALGKENPRRWKTNLKAKR
jgi:hypothetical protein